MDLLGIRSHIQESARQAAGSFLTPLTNAIAEQRRLVDSLGLVSKVRVEECKHMMTWSKYQVNHWSPSLHVVFSILLCFFRDEVVICVVPNTIPPILFFAVLRLKTLG